MIFFDRRFRRARVWSNAELRRIAPIFSGDVVNVSGWKDEDKEGSLYREYFINAKSYSITNYVGDQGFQDGNDEISLDLESQLSESLVRRFDVVFNHTTLEHVFDVTTAFGNLCEMARDAVIVVVPFAQTEHWSKSYGDYWRFSGQALERLFRKFGFEIAYCSANNGADEAVYVFAVGVRDAKKWDGRLPEATYVRPLAKWLGRPKKWEKIFSRLSSKDSGASL